MWRNQFTAKLNYLNDSVDAMQLLEQMVSCTLGKLEKVSTNEMKSIVRNLSSNKAISIDEIPYEFYKKKTPNCLLNFLAVYLNTMRCHSYVSCDISDVQFVPMIKDRLKNPSESSNYRPIAIATATSKNLEKIILSRLTIEVLGNKRLSKGVQERALN